MNLSFRPDNKQIYKKIFTLKPKQKDGLVLNIFHTDKKSGKIRFINVCFDKNGQTLVSIDNNGNIFVVDFYTSKFWKISEVIRPCTVLKFSAYNTKEILAGSSEGPVFVINIQSGDVTGKLIGHQNSPISISFAHDKHLCLTASTTEALVWDLRTNSKIFVLNLKKNVELKQANFMPVSSNILACLDDNVIQIWKYTTFETVALLQPALWGKHSVKNIVFTRNGQMMIVACHPSYLAVFLVSSWKIVKFISLPDNIQTIKYAEILPHLNDGGCNNLLAILSGQGVIHFYNIDQNVIISELQANYQINRFDWSKGNYIACVLCSGDVNIYDIMQYITFPVKITVKKAQQKAVKLKECTEKLGLLKEKIKNVLHIDKLKLILKQFGEYPDVYRCKIWEELLALPNNSSQYNAIINHRMVRSFESLNKNYPLEDKRSLKNLRKLLDNLTTWCPFFAHVPFLPVFVFPFVKIFNNNPVACFEAVCTIILNWCQFWFEYFPLPPVNVLAIIENVFLEQDPELLDHLSKHNVEGKRYAWLLLKTSFSEALTAQQWKIFWDHVLTNEQSFLLCAPVAYNILQRSTLLSLPDEKQLECFYKTHHPIDVKKLIAKTYSILESTSEKIHPRQYLQPFKRLQAGRYPDFCNYPKTIIDYQSEQLKAIQKEQQEVEEDEQDLIQQRIANLSRVDDLIIKDEERKRIVDLENAVKEKLIDRRKQIQQYHRRLSDLRTKLLNEEKQITDISRQKILKSNEDNRKKVLESLVNDVELAQITDECAAKRAENELLLQYSNLMRQRCSIEQLFTENNQKLGPPKSSVLDQQQELLAQEIEKVHKTVSSQRQLKLLNVAAGVAATDALITKIEAELKRETNGSRFSVNQNVGNLRVLKLKAETGELVIAINKLLRLLNEVRNSNSVKSSST